jgi:ECF sigma factor
LSAVSHRLPRSSCLWSTTNSAALPPSAWRTRSRARLSRPRPWFTRPIFGSWGWKTRAGKIAATSSPRRRKPCAAILVDNARRKAAIKAGGGHERVGLDEVEAELAIEGPRLDLPALDEALTTLEAKDKRKADLVRLRYFTGLTVDQAAYALGISASTADNDRVYAKSWLRVAMLGDEADGPED